MKKEKLSKLFLGCIAASLVSTSCNDESISSGTTYTPVPEGVARYVISTEIGDAAYMLTSETLEVGSVTAVNNGTEVDGGSVMHYVNNNYLYTINEIGGNDPVDVRAYKLDAATGRVQEIGYYSTTKYNSWGSWGDQFVYAAYLSNSTTTPNSSNGVDYSPVDVYYTIADPVTAKAKYGNITSEGFLLNEKIPAAERSPETVNFPAFTEAGGKMYVSVATQGVSKYATLSDNFTASMQSLIENEGLLGEVNDYVARGSGRTYTIAGSTAVSGYSSTFAISNGVPFPLTPDKARVVVYNGDDFEANGFSATPEAFITTDKIGQAYGRYYANPFNTLVRAKENGVDYAYVFSPGSVRRYNDFNVEDINAGKEELITQYSTTVETDWSTSNEIATPLRKVVSNTVAGVMRIKGGETAFDESFGNSGVVDLETLLGGYTFTRVWNIKGNKFLLRVMNEDKPTSAGYYYEFHKNTPTDARFAIYDADSNSIQYIDGLPTTAELREDNSSIGEPCFNGSMAYIPMSLTDKSYGGF